MSLWLGHLPLTTWQAGFGEVVTAQAPDASQLVQQGIGRYQAGDYTGAISPWQTALTVYQKTNSRANVAIILENLARAYQQLGQSEQAISHWQPAIAYYRQMKDQKQVGELLTEQAQSYSSLGQPRKAIALLCGASDFERVCIKGSALQIARAYKDRDKEAAALGSLGDAYRLQGDYTQAIAHLLSSLKIANPAYRSSALNSLGNVYISLASVNFDRANSADSRGDSTLADEFRKQAFSYDSKALQYFQNSLNLAREQNDRSAEVRALLNSIPLYQRTKASTLAATSVQQALVLLEHLPDSRYKVYATIEMATFVQSALDATSLKAQCLLTEVESKAFNLLNQAVAIAQRLKDPRSESFALGELGHLYECRQDLSRALDLTRQAELAAQQDLNAKDSLYLWQWQVGRIFKAQHQENSALDAYEGAVATLEDIRSDILIASRDLQFDFRDTIEPIYRELAALRLEHTTQTSPKSDERQKNLSTVLKTIDSLKLAELQNYFGNDCIVIRKESVEAVGADTATAVFSSIILNDRTAIVVSLPNGEKSYAWINVDSESLRQEINEFRRGLERYRDVTYDPKQAQKLYDWIVRPFASDLDSQQIETLVFIQDGILRSIPMAALHDGEKFLVEKYAIATTPSLTLTAPETKNLKENRALALGLTKDAIVNGRKFPALPYVGSEISQVETQIPGSKGLLDRNFTRDRLQQELGETSYSIIHIATHAEFGTVPEDTFLVTGNNGTLNIQDLDTVIRSVTNGDSVELLALTACETAVGDDRAALGLAGVAVQAGVRSVLASLWAIDDAATVTLVTEFYRGWGDAGVSKAEALRTAQQALISAGGKYAHPAYWAPFILIGNWL